MPRPIRIEYEGAFYHVMNRGRARQTIFHNDSYFEAFLEALQESSDRFDAQFHAYCLMHNHYHLLVETPRANLGRIMRHINGVYTQRHNRLRKTDGPLFRGRYKAILVDQDAYLLQLSRYIHRNPVDTKRTPISQLEDYPWSSYPAYINLVQAQHWLHRDQTYQALGQRNKYVGYQAYVSEGVDEEIHSHYNAVSTSAILGDKSFRETVNRQADHVDRVALRGVLQDRPGADDIIKITASVFSEDEKLIRAKPQGRRESNPARAFAMWACQHYGALALKDIALVFELGHVGSASFSINKIKNEIAVGQWKTQVLQFVNNLYIVK